MPGAAKLYAWVREECSRLGLLSEMEAIIAVSRRGTTSAVCRVRQACFHRAQVRAGVFPGGRVWGRASFYKGRAFLRDSFPQMRGRRVENVRFRFRQRISGAGILQSPGSVLKLES